MSEKETIEDRLKALEEMKRMFYFFLYAGVILNFILILLDIYKSFSN